LLEATRRAASKAAVLAAAAQVFGGKWSPEGATVSPGALETGGWHSIEGEFQAPATPRQCSSPIVAIVCPPDFAARWGVSRREEWRRVSLSLSWHAKETTKGACRRGGTKGGHFHFHFHLQRVLLPTSLALFGAAKWLSTRNLGPPASSKLGENACSFKRRFECARWRNARSCSVCLAASAASRRRSPVERDFRGGKLLFVCLADCHSGRMRSPAVSPGGKPAEQQASWREPTETCSNQSLELALSLVAGSHETGSTVTGDRQRQR